MRHEFHSTLSPVAGDAAWMERTGGLPGPADAAEAQFFLSNRMIAPPAPLAARLHSSLHYRVTAP
jgi:hypothetical protein